MLSFLSFFGGDVFRSHKRYYYRNAATGAAQWTYPEMDVIGGTEEMELCTTPPPEQEEPIIGKKKQKLNS